MKVALFVAGLCLASATASVVPVKGERKVADATFLNRQKMVLDLFVGLGHDDHFQNENANFDIMANAEHFSDPSVAKKFMETYQRGMLPKDHIFTLSCPHVRHQAIRLFDLFYFAKDFDTFYKSASWSKKYVNPMMFSYAFTLALVHRDDTRGFSFPPLYEMYPNYFVPEDIMHKFYDYKMSGIKHGKFEYNNTGYEYNYHDEMFGGPLSQDVYNPHSEYKISYFREDVGLNSLYAYAFKYPEWMCPKKYNLKGYFRRGELGYAFHQQLLARYTLERLANDLPYAEPLYFDRPVRVGYTPRIAHFNGESFIARPDGFNFDDALNKKFVYMAKHYEQRLFDAVDYGSYWNQSSDSMVDLMNEDGIDKLGQLAFGSISHHDPVGRYYGSYYYAFIDALANMVKTTNTKNFNGGVASMKMTTLRDPAFYNMLVRFVGLFQRHKSHLPVYMKKDLKFPGVSVTNIEFDKLVTYFDMFDYEITNGVGATDPKEYIDLRYQTSQFRLNHKPYNFKISVNSDAAYDGMVRLFIGPKFDAEERVMSLEQKRLAMFEIDRFPVKIAAGANVFERNSKESPIFAPDQEGFRTMYEKIDHALKTNEPYYINERITCGVPERLQLPKGWKSGHQYTFAVVVTPYENKPGHENQILCGSNKLYDGRPYGFPFDRPIWSNEFNIPNIYFKDEFIYHKEDAEVNRSSA